MRRDDTRWGQAQERRRPRGSGLFSYYGGKARIAGWVVENLPEHSGYVEPFCGSAQVLFAKERVPMEVLNDLDQGVTAALRAARDYPDELATALALTPYSRWEHGEATRAVEQGLPADVVEAARLFITMTQQQMFPKPTPMPWRQQGATSGCREARTWGRLPERVWDVAQRLQGVAIECRDAAEVIAYCDHPEVLFYLDPPYHPASCDVKGYRHRLTVQRHHELAELLRDVQGMVVLSGFRHPDYAEWFADWPTVEKERSCGTSAGAGGTAFKRTEVLWFNERAWERRQARSVGGEQAQSG